MHDLRLMSGPRTKAHFSLCPIEFSRTGRTAHITHTPAVVCLVVRLKRTADRNATPRHDGGETSWLTTCPCVTDERDGTRLPVHQLHNPAWPASMPSEKWGQFSLLSCKPHQSQPTRTQMFLCSGLRENGIFFVEHSRVHG